MFANLLYCNTDKSALDNYIQRIIEQYIDNNISCIRELAFASCYELKSVSCNNCVNILGEAFYQCSLLQSVYFNNCISIGSYAFANCKNLQTISFPKCTYVGHSVFDGCSALQMISFPECSQISWGAFGYMSAVSVANFPKLTYITSCAFGGCTNLRAAYFDGNSTVYSIKSYAFSNCRMLESLYLLYSEMAKLENKNTFQGTPISTYTTSLGHNGSIFVPASLFNSYKTATNWVTYSARFASLTDAEVSAIKAQMGIT